MTDLLRFYRPTQRADDGPEVEHFHLTGWTELLHESYPWPHKLEIGVPAPRFGNKILSTDKGHILLKTPKGDVWEDYELVDERCCLVAEKGASAQGRESYRLQPHNIETGLVWFRSPQENGAHWINRFYATEHAKDGSRERHYSVTAPVFYGPFNLNKPHRRAQLATLLGRFGSRTVSALKSMGGHIGKPGKPVVVVLRREFWGAYDYNKLGDSRDLEHLYQHSEDYLDARCGRFTFGRVGWAKREALTRGAPHVVQRGSWFPEVVMEPFGERILPAPHLALGHRA